MTVETCFHDPAKRKKFGVRHIDGLDYCETCWNVTPESLHAVQNRLAPAGLAREARERGDQFFEIQLDIGESSRDVNFGPADSGGRTESSNVDVLTQIEAEGWRLEHAGYVFVQTGHSTRAKIIGTGEKVAVSGITVGVYLLRSVEGV